MSKTIKNIFYFSNPTTVLFIFSDNRFVVDQTKQTGAFWRPRVRACVWACFFCKETSAQVRAWKSMTVRLGSLCLWLVRRGQLLLEVFSFVPNNCSSIEFKHRVTATSKTQESGNWWQEHFTAFSHGCGTAECARCTWLTAHLARL